MYTYSWKKMTKKGQKLIKKVDFYPTKDYYMIKDRLIK